MIFGLTSYTKYKLLKRDSKLIFNANIFMGNYGLDEREPYAYHPYCVVCGLGEGSNIYFRFSISIENRASFDL